MDSSESSPELDAGPVMAPAAVMPSPGGVAASSSSSSTCPPFVELAHFLAQEEERKRRRDLEATAETAAANHAVAGPSSSAPGSTTTTRAASPQRRRSARAQAMDSRWEEIRAAWLTEFPEQPLPLVRPTADTPPYPQRPPVQSNPSSRDLSSVISARRGVQLPRPTQGVAPRVRTPPSYGHAQTPFLPPSPLGKISDDQVSYFSGVAESLNGTSPSEGMVIQSPDGRPAIFFQPQRSHRSSSGATKSNSAIPSRLTTDQDRDGTELLPSLLSQSPTSGPGDGPNTPPMPSTARVAAPHEIGLGQGRRLSSPSSNGGSPESISPLPVGTPALTLDSFIAKSRGQSDDSLPSPEEVVGSSSSGGSGTHSTLKKRPSSTASSVSRQASSNSIPSRPPSTRPLSTGSSPRVSAIARSASTPPLSPRPDEAGHPHSISAPIVPHIPHHQPTPLAPIPAVPAVPRPSPVPQPTHSRRTSGQLNNGARKAKNARRAAFPTVPPIKVLIVEDNQINQRILSKFLQSKGVKYDVAKDGEEAVQKWRQGSFHLVLMDIQLPVKDGIEATRDIRDIERATNVGTLISTPTSDPTSPFPAIAAASPTSPPLTMPVIIVALTASSLQIDRVSALAAGCNDFLTKPVSLPWLQQKLLEWGSMAYLSGFSRQHQQQAARDMSAAASKNPSPSMTPLRVSEPAFSAGLNSRAAQVISAHLHIERKQHGDPGSRSGSPGPHSKSAASYVNVAAAGSSSSSPSKSFGPNDHKGPDLTVSSPTPVLTPDPQDSPADNGVTQDRPLDVKAVDARIEDLKAAAAANRRPGPSPLAGGGHMPSLEDVMSEGARLAESARTRSSSSSNSFSAVMLDSGTVPSRSPQ